MRATEANREIMSLLNELPNVERDRAKQSYREALKLLEFWVSGYCTPSKAGKFKLAMLKNSLVADLGESKRK